MEIVRGVVGTFVFGGIGASIYVFANGVSGVFAIGDFVVSSGWLIVLGTVLIVVGVTMALAALSGSDEFGFPRSWAGSRLIQVGIALACAAGVVAILATTDSKETYIREHPDVEFAN